MAVYSAAILSESTTGRGIKVAATSGGGSGTAIHTVPSSVIDEVYLWAVNTDSTARKLSLELGGTTGPDDLLELTIQPEDGPVLVVPGWRFEATVAITAFAASANVINIFGNINRIT